MNRAVLELNDHQLGLYNHNGLMFSSPGYVVVNGKHIQFGQQAAEQSRLNPLGTNNEFWYRLGMTPLTRPVAHYRHYADVAHGHLMHLAQESGFEGEIVIAVPASFSREQLAVLTGVLKHSPFTPVAMMDAALVSASHQLAAGAELLYVDVQLHQISLTRLQADGVSVRRDAVSVVLGAGWTAISNILVQTATDAFVAQSRFNPQHSAAWEQQLYNQIAQWLQHFQSGEQELIARIHTDKNTVQARISLSDVLDALEPVFQKLAQHAARIITSGSMPVLLSDRAALIPGLQDCLQAIHHSVSPEQLAEMCLRVAANAATQSTNQNNTVPFLNALAIDAVRSERNQSPVSPTANIGLTQSKAPATSPTHLLHDGVAWPLPVAVYHQVERGLVLASPSSALALNGTQQRLFMIDLQDKHIILTADTESITVNEKPVSERISLQTGDQIGAAGVVNGMQCIRVLGIGAAHG